MTWTAEDLDALKKALARGVLRLKQANGDEVQFANPADMRRTIADIEAELAGGAGAFPRRHYPATTRGHR
jgi:hypothetical protein